MSPMRAGTALLALMLESTAFALPTFTLTDLGDLPGGSNQSWANGINNLGHVVGASMAVTASAADLGWRPFIWTPGAGIKRLTAPSGFSIGAGATGINDSDVVSGFNGCTSCSPLIAYSGWTWSGDAATGAGTVTGTSSVNVARGISNSGQVAGHAVLGSYANPATQTAQAYRYTPGSPATVTNLGHLAGGTTSSAWAINGSGNVVGAASSSVGQQPYIYLNGSGMQALTSTAKGIAYDINDANQVVGQLQTASGSGNGEAFLWSAAQGLITLGGVNWEAEAINNNGWVVGCIWSNQNCVNRNGTGGYLWTAADGLHNLFDLIDPADPLKSGMVINNVPGVNDLGQIVVNATRNHVQHAYLLTPLAPAVPEPSSLLLLAAGAVVLCGVRRAASPAASPRSAAYAWLGLQFGMLRTAIAPMLRVKMASLSSA